MAKPPNKPHSGNDVGQTALAGSTRNGRPVSKSERPALIKCWRDALHVIDTYSEKLCDNVFDDVKRSILDKIISAAGRNARLNGYDEKIYDYYKHLMDYYEMVAGLYEENGRVIVTPGVRDIIEGIYDVVSSQLKQFKEGQDGTYENPVAREKKSIVIKSIQLFTANFDAQKTIFKKQYLWDGIMESRRYLLDHFGHREAVLVTSYMIELIQDNCNESFYSDYYNAVALCSECLNDLHNRTSTAYYYELLEKERDILGAIIKVQVSALETVLDKPSILAGERSLVEKILTVLREGYQYYGREVMEIISGFRKAESTVHNLSVENYDTLSASLESFIGAKKEQLQTHLFDRCKTLYQEKLSLFKKCLYQECENLFDVSLISNKNIYDMQKNISEQVLMAEEMVRVFQKLIDFYDTAGELEKSLDSGEYDIVKGISETVKIKIESLNDNIKAFEEDCVEIIAQMSAQVKEKIKTSEDELAEGTDALFDKWKIQFTGMRDPIRTVGIKSFFNQCLLEEPFLSFRQRAERTQTQYRDKLNKKITGFKRENILFEVSTYEEIINYSVSRLKQSENSAVTRYVESADEVTESIGTILKKNNIAMIKPEPHDLFNGKEHEVLMAEKNQEFKKGEIIKLMNTGYKQYDVIILRANVIAAK